MLKRLVPLFILTLVTCAPVAVSAQSSLQNNQTNLQQETGQTQNTRSLQDNTADVQSNDSGDVLNQNQSGSLGVVSDPKQTQPDVVVDVTPTTTTLMEVKRDNNRLGIVLIVMSIIGLIISFRTYRKAEQTLVVAEAPAPKPKKAKPAASVKAKEPALTTATKKAPKTKSKKKKKKSHR